MTDAAPSRPHPFRRTAPAAAVLAAFFIYTYFVREVPGPDALDIRGATMGTTYQVRAAGSTLSVKDVADLRMEIERYLDVINQAMSTYLPDSEISRFNAHRQPTPFEVSADLVRVTWYALELSRLSNGAFDPTMGPLIDLWGFGHSPPPESPPDPQAVEQARARTGAHLVEVVDGRHLAKARPDVEMNLSAAAKGFAVDGVSLLLADRGLTNTYVEIGGEIVVRGTNPEGLPWRIGVELPQPGAFPGEHIVRVVTPGNQAVAGSGDYRNYHVDDAGRRRSHLIDPVTGYPIDHRLASVSVIAPNCMAADGIATALMIMGPESGPTWIESMPNAEALFVIRMSGGDDKSADGDFEIRTSSGFEAYLAE